MKGKSQKRLVQTTKKFQAIVEKRQMEVKRLQDEGLTIESSHLRAEIKQSSYDHEADIKHVKDQNNKYENEWKIWHYVVLVAVGAAAAAAAVGVAVGAAAGQQGLEQQV